MGLYDREYGRSDERSPWERSQSPRSFTITLIVINAAVYLLALAFSEPAPPPINRISHLTPWFAISAETLIQPWMWWQFISYGFFHSVGGINHVLFNMIALFFFGRMVEQRLGRMEFLRFYLVALVMAGIVGSATSLMVGLAAGAPVEMIPTRTIGASGAVVGVTILFACFYPHAEVLLMFVLPVKAWVLAVLFVGMDLAGALGIIGAESNTAFTVHLAGAGFALLYYFRGWNLKWLDLAAIADFPNRLRQRSRRMKLKLHDPEKKLEQEAEEADRILEKIHRSGEESLTSSERRTLERYSRRQREKRGE